MNLVTVGIPTYNRAKYLNESISSVLYQTYHGIDLVISNNGSSDKTDEVIANVKLENPNFSINSWKFSETCSASANFKKVLELAKTKYFTWLQDDDIIHCEFVKRGVSALDFNDKASVYCAYAQYGPLPLSKNNLGLWGPSFSLNWFANETLSINGFSVIAFSVFTTLGYSPTAIFRKDSLDSASHYLDSSFWLFAERVILSKAAMGNEVIIDPFIGGLFRAHSSQEHKKVNHKVLDDQYERMLDELLNLYRNEKNQVVEEFRRLLKYIENDCLIKWYYDRLKWRNYNMLTVDCYDCLENFLLTEDCINKEESGYLLRGVERTKRYLKGVLKAVIDF